MRVLDLGLGWEFVMGRVRPGWADGQAPPHGEPVDLPHCWNAHDTFQAGVVPYRGRAAYRRTFRLPEGAPTTGVWRLEADGFYGTGEVWLNGLRIGAVDGQFLGFQLECGAVLSHDRDNRLGIRLSNRCPLHVLPGHPSPDFILHGGLAGGVRLVHRPVTRIHRKTVSITTGREADGSATVHLGCDVVGAAAHDGPIDLVWRILDASGATVAESEPLRLQGTVAGAGSRVGVELEVKNPLRWGVEHPHLYRAEGRLLADGEVVDEVAVRFGVRTAEFRPDQGFFLDGERVLLQGCNRHESIPGFGQALPESLQRADARELKSMGFNFVRLAHYPQHAAFLDACDELGIVVYAEIASWKSVRSGRWLSSAVRQLEAMILRDRNRPCIAIWGLGNESRSRRAYTVLRERAGRLDPTRPVTYAENHTNRARWNRIAGIPDVWGINYDLAAIDRARGMSRLRNVLVSECLPYRAARRGDDAAETAQVRTLIETLDTIDRHPDLAGYAIWAFADYATMHRRRFRRFSGLLDAWRAPKLSSLVMRARLSPEPFVRIRGPWGVRTAANGGEEEGDTRAIHVVSNCPEVSLLHDGRLVEKLQCHLHQVCDVPFLGGDLVAVGRRQDGTAQDRLTAFGPPARLSVEPEIEGGEALTRETVPMTIRVVDDQGHQVTTWGGDATAAVEGPASLRSFTRDGRVTLARGQGRTFVTGTGAPGAARITVRCLGLEDGAATIGFVEGDA